MEGPPEEADPATQDFILQQTMLRIKDPQKSLTFYNKCLGMTLLLKLDSPSMKFSQYVMGYEDSKDIPEDMKEREAWAYSCKATVVLTQDLVFAAGDSQVAPPRRSNPRRQLTSKRSTRGPDKRRSRTGNVPSNWGSENDEKTFHNGNTDPLGFGHIGIAVPDVYAACQRFEQLGVTFVKKPKDGKRKGLAFIEDPDGYWIEIFSPDTMASIFDVIAGPVQ